MRITYGIASQSVGREGPRENGERLKSGNSRGSAAIWWANRPTTNSTGILERKYSGVYGVVENIAELRERTELKKRPRSAGPPLVTGRNRLLYFQIRAHATDS